MVRNKTDLLAAFFLSGEFATEEQVQSLYLQVYGRNDQCADVMEGAEERLADPSCSREMLACCQRGIRLAMRRAGWFGWRFGEAYEDWLGQTWEPLMDEENGYAMRCGEEMVLPQVTNIAEDWDESWLAAFLSGFLRATQELKAMRLPPQPREISWPPARNLADTAA
ncbi:hypothetical protein AB4090_05175 [Acidithiobacillus sp. IBUN Pt1247-S3]|uniref:hypothetical protein n=1 Tax=Acidithiobacillus sp. IBUN Pt1247-S3 TaxID=3166642 RepID=UPI0034E5726B